MNRRSILSAALAFLAGMFTRKGPTGSSDISFHEYSSPECGGRWVGWLERAGECIGFVYEDGSYLAMDQLV